MDSTDFFDVTNTTGDGSENSVTLHDPREIMELLSQINCTYELCYALKAPAEMAPPCIQFVFNIAREKDANPRYQMTVLLNPFGEILWHVYSGFQNDDVEVHARISAVDAQSIYDYIRRCEQDAKDLTLLCLKGEQVDGFLFNEKSINQNSPVMAGIGMPMETTQRYMLEKRDEFLQRLCKVEFKRQMKDTIGSFNYARESGASFTIFLEPVKGNIRGDDRSVFDKMELSILPTGEMHIFLISFDFSKRGYLRLSFTRRCASIDFLCEKLIQCELKFYANKRLIFSLQCGILLSSKRGTGDRMNVEEKLVILSDAAKYDASCVSSGSNRPKGNATVGAPSSASAGICHTWAADGRCVSLLKVLYSNSCKYDCAYCINRRSNDRPRATFTPEELCALTIGFYRRNYIEGLFLSSGVIHSPDHTMELMIRTLELLRNKERFGGYIHAKAIPGASQTQIDRLGLLCDRMSVNIELPSSQSLALLAPEKSKDSVVQPMHYLAQRIKEEGENKRIFNAAPAFVPAGQSTQLIVGATPDTDLTILNLTQSLYKKFNLKRVFYSAYIPLNDGDSRLPVLPHPPLLREHRLYQSDFLLRFYGFTANELLTPEMPSLDLAIDPKAMWALRNLDRFPVEINTAPYETLLRIPGLGITCAQRIVKARRVAKLTFEDLKKLGVAFKRTRHFMLCGGKYYGGKLEADAVRHALISHEMQIPGVLSQQMNFFPHEKEALLLGTVR